MVDSVTQPVDTAPTGSSRVWLASGSAFVASTALLILAAGSERQTLGVATSPFGWNRVIVIYSFSSLMLSWSIARLLMNWTSTEHLSSRKSVWYILILLIGGFTLIAGPTVGQVLSELQTGEVARAVCRILWCVLLQIPWLMLAVSVKREPERHLTHRFSTWHLLILGLVAAIGIPFSFLAVFLDEQTIQAHRYWQETKIVNAQRIVQRLCDVGSIRPIGQREMVGQSGKSEDVTPRQALSDLRAGARFFEEKQRLLAVGDLTDQRVMDLVTCYIALDRLDEAVAAIEPLSRRDPRAALRLADLQRQLGRAQDCQATAERVLQLAERLKRDNATDVERMENLQFGAYEMLVVLAGERADYAMAERILHDALEHLPSRRADVHSNLTKHFEFIGDFSKAAVHQTKAAHANPERYSAPDALWKKMLSSGAPVGLARPKSSRYQ